MEDSISAAPVVLAGQLVPRALQLGAGLLPLLLERLPGARLVGQSVLQRITLPAQGDQLQPVAEEGRRPRRLAAPERRAQGTMRALEGLEPCDQGPLLAEKERGVISVVLSLRLRRDGGGGGGEVPAPCGGRELGELPQPAAELAQPARRVGDDRLVADDERVHPHEPGQPGAVVALPQGDPVGQVHAVARLERAGDGEGPAPDEDGRHRPGQQRQPEGQEDAQARVLPDQRPGAAGTRWRPRRQGRRRARRRPARDPTPIRVRSREDRPTSPRAVRAAPRCRAPRRRSPSSPGCPPWRPSGPRGRAPPTRDDRGPR